MADGKKGGEHGAWISLVAYVCLSILKLTIGTTAHSEALVADGLNNATDILATAAVLIGLIISRKPPDSNHRYGHSRAETIAALVASLLILTVGIQVLIHAGTTFYNGSTTAPSAAAAWTAVIGAIVMFLVASYNSRLAKKINSDAVSALAKDNLSDALVSIGAFAGVVGAIFGFPWLDPLAALVVGVVICLTAVGIFKDASLSLSDGFDERRLRKFKKTILSVPGVQTVKDIRARNHGKWTFVDVTIEVHGHLNVMESHDISELIELRMQERHRIQRVHIHVEPLTASQDDQSMMGD